MNATSLLLSLLAVIAALSLASPKFLMAETQIGIDLGTTFSVVAVCSSGNTTVIPVDGAPIVPSVISFDPSANELVVGAEAVKRRMKAPLSTAYNVKRVIGRAAEDSELQSEQLPFKYFPNGSAVEIELMGRRFSPESLSGAVLKRLKRAAEEAQGWRHRLGFKFGSVTVTVPVSFGARQRGATRRAAVQAGFKQIRLVEEPVSAAMAYGLHNAPGRRNVMVYDLGGGTLDVALLSLEDGVFRVEYTTGDSRLGGNDFDRSLAELLQEVARNQSCQGLLETAEDEQRLILKAEILKRQLSSSKRSESLSVELGAGCTASVSTEQFERHSAELFRRALKPVSELLQVTHTKQEEIDEVVLVGGATRMPQISRQLVDFFGRNILHSSIDPDEAIAIGAASGFGC